MKLQHFCFLGIFIVILGMTGCQDPEGPDNLYLQADTLSVSANDAGDWKTIKKLLDTALRKRNDHYPSLLLRGYANYRLDDMRAACEDFRLAKSYAPLDPITLYWNGWVYHKMGEQGDERSYATALTFLKEALNACPEKNEMRESILVMLINSCLVTGSPGGEKYVDELKTFSELRRKAELMNAEGIFHFRNQNYDDAVKYIRMAWAFDKNNVTYCENLAIIFSKYLQDKEQAKDWYRSAIRSAVLRKDTTAKSRLLNALTNLK